VRGFYQQDEVRRVPGWRPDGHLRSIGTRLDIGNTILDPLRVVPQTGRPRMALNGP
jgi:hypothetical protein